MAAEGGPPRLGASQGPLEGPRVTRELGLDAARSFLGQKSLGTTNEYGDALDLQAAARAAAMLA